MTSKQLADLIGVSQSTVSRALNGSSQISEKRRNEIILLAKKYRFEFNQNARNLRARRTNCIGILLHGYSHGSAENIREDFQCTHLQLELSRLGYDAALLCDKGSENAVDELDRSISRLQLAGLIVPGIVSNKSMCKFLASLPIPALSLASKGAAQSKLFSVAPDSYGGASLAASHFIKRGFRKIAMIDVRPLKGRDQDKFLGFVNTLRKSKITLSAQGRLCGDYSFESGYKAVERNLSFVRSCDAIFSSNDLMALGAIDAMKRNGVRVPQDVSVLGMDDIPMCQWTTPKLSTVRVDIERQTRLACKMLVSLLEQRDASAEKQLLVPASLVLRESCL